LDESERAELERRYFSDKQLFERLCALEDDLVDRSLSGSLSEEDERLFASHYLQLPHAREKVEFTRALKEAILSQTGASASARVASHARPSLLHFLLATNRRILTAAAAVIAVIGFSWLAFHNRRLEKQLQEANHELGRRQLIIDQTFAQLKRSESPPREETKPLIVSFVLTPGAVRAAGQAKRLLIPSQAEAVRFAIEFGGSPNYSSYRAVLQTAEFTEVWSETSLTARPGDSKNQISVTVPTNVLPSGDYVMHIQGVLAGREPEAIASYTFRVLRR
jgi:hypothetical protein